MEFNLDEIKQIKNSGVKWIIADGFDSKKEVKQAAECFCKKMKEFKSLHSKS